MAQREISSGIGRPQLVRLEPAAGTWLWILHRLTAWGLLLFLGVHMWFNHFALLDSAQAITFELVSRRFQLYPFLYAINDSLLLACTIFHGFNGVRNVVYDLTVSTGIRRFTTVTLVILGLVLFALGVVTLWAFLGVTV